MRKLSIAFLGLMSLIIPLVTCATTYPVVNYVVDEAKILSTSDYQALTAKLKAFNEETSNEIAILIVNTTEPETIEDYSIHVTDQWKLGKKNKDNGILFTIAIQDRKMRIEVGRGLEGVLTDLLSTKILNSYARPQFKLNNYVQGINDTTDAIMSIAKNEFDSSELEKGDIENGKNQWQGVAYVMIFFLTFLLRIMAMSKSWWAGGIYGLIIAIVISYIYAFTIYTSILAGIIAIIFGLLLDYGVSKYGRTKDGKPAHGFWGFISSGSSSGSGGGFSGGGGGFSGGGGSSSW